MKRFSKGTCHWEVDNRCDPKTIVIDDDSRLTYKQHSSWVVCAGMCINGSEAALLENVDPCLFKETA